MSISAAAFLILTVVVLPLLAWLSKKKLDQGFTFPRLPFYLESIGIQTILLTASVTVAWLSRIPLRFDLPDPGEIVLGLGVLFVALATMVLGWRLASEITKQRLLAIVPATRKERIVWIVVSAAAALGEEVTYRGVLFELMHGVFGTWLVAALIASTIFAGAHLVQGWKNAGIIVVFAFVFHLLVRVTGSLTTAVAIHFLYDLITGYTLPRLERRKAIDDDEPNV
ncbi:MAG TPA: type II CAAX endopeptidase family protein [Thermoanaerobaculia bacterium]|nr:type II CAAX endopeptidase family protein [Thermoanaerobaculia bacterium]